MSSPNDAEEKFENFSVKRKWKIFKIPELPGIQTPDYFVVVNGQAFICEIKTLSKSKAERKDIAEFRDNEGNVVCVHYNYNIEIGSIARKIGEANRQFKFTTSFALPQVLIIYSERFHPLDKDITLRAMYGKVFQRLRIKTSKNNIKRVSINLPPLVQDRTLRKDKNNFLSAVVIPNRQNGMLVFHNLWASVPLPASIFNKDDDINYIPGEVIFKETYSH